MDFSHFNVEFDKTGAIFDAAQVDAVVNAAVGLTDLVVISHGWNNDMAEAAQLYDDFFRSVDKVLGINSLAERLAKPLAARTFGVARVFWPSKKFAPQDLIPAGGVASTGSEALTNANRKTLFDLLEALKHDPSRLGGTEIDDKRAAAMDRAKALIPNLKTDANARIQFVDALRSVLDSSQAEPDDGADEFFNRDPLELFERLGGSVVAPPPPNASGAASLRDVVDAAGAAIASGVSAVGNTLSDVAEGTEAAARRLANYATYAKMKERAGVVGRTGVSELLRKVKAKNPDLKLHLVGHSFGGRLVTAAASTLDGGTVAGMTLLQAAFSHNGLGEKYDDKHDGFFRTVIKDRRVTGPIIITHTKNDVAVGIAYPLASRLTRDTASAIGDENDPYGGMGRNGAQHTPEVQTPAGSLLQVGPQYSFVPGKVHNLRADEFIMDHGDVTGYQVAYAFLNAVLKV